jgi:hypothetical protein
MIDKLVRKSLRNIIRRYENRGGWIAWYKKITDISLCHRFPI